MSRITVSFVAWLVAVGLHQPLQELYRSSLTAGVEFGLPRAAGLLCFGMGALIWLGWVVRSRGIGVAALSALLLGLTGWAAHRGATHGEALHTIQYGALTLLAGAGRPAAGLLALGALVDEGVEAWGSGSFDLDDLLLNLAGAGLVYLGRRPARELQLSK